MKQVFFIAVIAIGTSLMSCDGSTSSDSVVDSTSANTIIDSVHADSSAPKDTVYPKTDTTSYRKDTAQKAVK